jgi:hypothetical protein
MKKLRRITEAEVVSEFLKAEFYHAEYSSDRHKFETIVLNPDLANEIENTVRRALLFRRRGTMWRELPKDIQWWEIELEYEELDRVNVFPRAQWRRISDGNFQALHIANRIRRRIERGKSSEWLSKIQLVHTRLKGDGPKSTVLLIGMDDNHPLTLLEGNHRFVSALLLPRELIIRRLRLVCGFSPNMEQCCWYKTDLTNLFRYTKNRIKHLWSREADPSLLASLLQERERTGDYAEAVTVPHAKSE